MSKFKELEEIKNDFEFYKDNLSNKNYCFIYSKSTNKQLTSLKNKTKLNNLVIFEIKFEESFYPHALGIKPYKMNIEELINKIKRNTLEIKDYQLSLTRGLKREALKKLPNTLKGSLIIGDYDNSKDAFDTNKLLGSTKNSRDASVGLIVIPTNINNKIQKYIPNSLQNEITKNYIINGTERKILFTLEKEKGQEKYNTILFKAKDIPIHNLYYNETIKQYLSVELQEIIKKQITNYNCLTGEPINIENHSSGENKWIAKKDVEKLEIEKKDNVKEKIGKIAVMMTEKEMEDYKKNRGMETKEITNPSNEKKLYIIPVLYYNISDLKITKEIEQKFVPMKEKEKSQEIDKSKGQGIGD